VGRATTAVRLDPRDGQSDAADRLHLADSVVPMTGASMRILEGLLAFAALVTAILIGIGR
jgi:hypothetical protein